MVEDSKNLTEEEAHGVTDGLEATNGPETPEGLNDDTPSRKAESSSISSRFSLKADVADLMESSGEDDEGSAKGNRWSFRKTVVIAVSSIVLAASLGVAVPVFVFPAIDNHYAQQKLSSIHLGSGKVSALNTSTTVFKGQTLENVNVEQKQLTGAGVSGSDGAIFAFGGSRDSVKSDDKTRIVDLYVDMGSQNSRDLILMNQNTLKNMIKNDSIQLRIHPVPTSNAYSVYAAEAMCEVFVTNPDLAWDALISILKASASLDSDKKEDMLQAVSDAVSSVGVKDIDKESISNGTFSGWIVKVGDDKRLKTGYYPPIVYVNGVEVDQKVFNLNNPDVFSRAILSTGGGERS